MGKVTYDPSKNDTLKLFSNGGIILTGRNLNPAWIKKVREEQSEQATGPAPGDKPEPKPDKGIRP